MVVSDPVSSNCNDVVWWTLVLFMAMPPWWMKQEVVLTWPYIVQSSPNLMCFSPGTVITQEIDVASACFPLSSFWGPIRIPIKNQTSVNNGSIYRGKISKFDATPLSIKVQKNNNDLKYRKIVFKWALQDFCNIVTLYTKLFFSKKQIPPRRDQVWGKHRAADVQKRVFTNLYVHSMRRATRASHFH